MQNGGQAPVDNAWRLGDNENVTITNRNPHCFLIRLWLASLNIGAAMTKQTLSDAELRMKGAVSAFEKSLGGMRTDRASPALVEELSVDYYGAPTQLQQLATIAVPEPQMITIRPFDPNSINEIERAIQTSDLGLTPSNDGKIVRLTLPPLSEERRQDLVKQVQKRSEESKVAIRNVRRDALEMLREMEDEKLVGEDDFHRAKDDLQKLTDQYSEHIDEVSKRKEEEILTV
jgi:ribosome recycling factor